MSSCLEWHFNCDFFFIKKLMDDFGEESKYLLINKKKRENSLPTRDKSIISINSLRAYLKGNHFSKPGCVNCQNEVCNSKLLETIKDPFIFTPIINLRSIETLSYNVEQIPFKFKLKFVIRLITYKAIMEAVVNLLSIKSIFMNMRISTVINSQ